MHFDPVPSRKKVNQVRRFSETMPLLAIAVLATLLIGWPAIRATEAIWWSTDALVDAQNDHELAVKEVLELLDLPDHLGFPLFWDKVGERYPCHKPESPVVMDPLVREAREHAGRAFTRSVQTETETRFYLLEYNILYKLPKPLLGAMLGCLQGSIVQGFCRTYVERHIESEVKRSNKQFEVSLSANIVSIDRAWCLIDKKLLASSQIQSQVRE